MTPSLSREASDHAAMRVAVRVREAKRTRNFIVIRFLIKKRKDFSAAGSEFI